MVSKGFWGVLLFWFKFGFFIVCMFVGFGVRGDYFFYELATNNRMRFSLIYVLPMPDV